MLVDAPATRVATLALLVFAPAGCAGSVEPEPVPLPWTHPTLPSPSSGESAEPEHVARVELGRLLFYDPILSSERQTACATCHSEIWGMSDGLPRSVGSGAGLLAGPGREGGPTLRRNAPGLWNLVFRQSFLWDGRVNALEAQALMPLRDADELGRDPAQAVSELGSIQAYRQLFAAAFPDDPEPSVAHLTQSLASFERSLTSLNALYDGYASGDRHALGARALEGMSRFAALGCADCHRPPLFESEAYFDRGIGGDDDAGRYEHTHMEQDRGAFRVPTLRNVAFTAPYFHDGSVARLEDAIVHELSRASVPYNERDVEAIVAFVRDGLKDESREPDRPRTLPSGLQVPIDGTQIAR